MSSSDINFSEVDTDLLMIATIHAAGGVINLLRTFFKESITLLFFCP